MKLENEGLDRRELLKLGAGALGVSAGALMIGCGGSAGLSTNGPTATATASTTSTGTTTGGTGGTDAVYLSFLLNFEYLKAQYYSIGVNGTYAANAGFSPSSVTGGSKVSFTIPDIAGMFASLARDELIHVTALQSLIGGGYPTQPPINFTTAFATFSQISGFPIPSFNAFASDDNFLLGAYYMEDAAITAQYGVLSLLTSQTNIIALAGIMGVDCYHAGAVRGQVFDQGSSVYAAAVILEGFRAQLGGGNEISPIFSSVIPNIAAINLTTGELFSRSTLQAENVFYENAGTGTNATFGGFFPSGLSGSITSSRRARR